MSDLKITLQDFKTILEAIKKLAKSSRTRRVSLYAKRVVSQIEELDRTRFEIYESELASRTIFYILRFLTRIYERLNYGVVVDREELLQVIDRVLSNLESFYEDYITRARSRGLKKLDQRIVIIDYDSFRPMTAIDYVADARLLQRYVKFLDIVEVGEAQCALCGSTIRGRAVRIDTPHRTFYIHEECFLAPCVKMICKGADCSINMETDKIRSVRSNIRRLYLTENEHEKEQVPKRRRLLLTEAT